MDVTVRLAPHVGCWGSDWFPFKPNQKWHQTQNRCPILRFHLVSLGNSRFHLVSLGGVYTQVCIRLFLPAGMLCLEGHKVHMIQALRSMASIGPEPIEASKLRSFARRSRARRRWRSETPMCEPTRTCCAGALRHTEIGRHYIGMCINMGVAQNQWYHFGVDAPPIIEPLLVGIGMFTGVRDFDPWPYVYVYYIYIYGGS